MGCLNLSFDIKNGFLLSLYCKLIDGKAIRPQGRLTFVIGYLIVNQVKSNHQLALNPFHYLNSRTRRPFEYSHFLKTVDFFLSKPVFS